MFDFSKGVYVERNGKYKNVLEFDIGKDGGMIFGRKMILFTKYYPFKKKDGKKKTKWKGNISIRGKHNTIWILDNYCASYYI